MAAAAAVIILAVSTGAALCGKGPVCMEDTGIAHRDPVAAASSCPRAVIACAIASVAAGKGCLRVNGQRAAADGYGGQTGGSYAAVNLLAVTTGDAAFCCSRVGDGERAAADGDGGHIHRARDGFAVQVKGDVAVRDGDARSQRYAALQPDIGGACRKGICQRAFSGQAIGGIAPLDFGHRRGRRLDRYGLIGIAHGVGGAVELAVPRIETVALGQQGADDAVVSFLLDRRRAAGEAAPGERAALGGKAVGAAHRVDAACIGDGYAGCGHAVARLIIRHTAHRVERAAGHGDGAGIRTHAEVVAILVRPGGGVHRAAVDRHGAKDAVDTACGCAADGVYRAAGDGQGLIDTGPYPHTGAAAAAAKGVERAVSHGDRRVGRGLIVLIVDTSPAGAADGGDRRVGYGQVAVDAIAAVGGFTCTAHGDDRAAAAGGEAAIDAVSDGIVAVQGDGQQGVVARVDGRSVGERQRASAIFDDVRIPGQRHRVVIDGGKQVGAVRIAVRHDNHGGGVGVIGCGASCKGAVRHLTGDLGVGVGQRAFDGLVRIRAAARAGNKDAAGRGDGIVLHVALRIIDAIAIISCAARCNQNTAIDIDKLAVKSCIDTGGAAAVGCAAGGIKRTALDGHAARAAVIKPDAVAAAGAAGGTACRIDHAAFDHQIVLGIYAEAASDICHGTAADGKCAVAFYGQRVT